MGHDHFGKKYYIAYSAVSLIQTKVQGGRISILQDILGWAKGLPAWQSDGIARLFAKQVLSQEDLEDLYVLLKAEHGIPDPKGERPTSLATTRSQRGPKPTRMLSCWPLRRHVNAIAGNQRLAFGAKGLTVIYGDNGSGKSGYTRVLKRACRARDQSEPIHPNAYLPLGKVGTAEAVFELSINGVAKDADWVNGTPAPEELSSLGIFDSHCARAYLDEEDDFAYVPYGLDILEGLARVCKQLDSLIRAEQLQNAVDRTAFADLSGTPTAVGKVINGLSAKTRPAQVEALATVSVEEAARRDELDKSLKADNPKEKASQHRRRSARIAKLARSAAEKLAIVDGATLTKLQGLTEAYRAAKAGAELAPQGFKAGPALLPGSGGEAWKQLFEAARKFCTEAHPGKVFPDLGPESQCPLCQQPLKDAAERLMRFEKLIQAKAEKNAQACRKAFEHEYEVFTTKSVVLGIDDELFAEIGELDKALATAARDFEQAIAERHGAIKAACVSREWDKITAEPVSPTVQLQALADELAGEALNLDKASDENARAVMQAEVDELDARLKLSKVKAAVLAAIGKLELQAKLTKCLAAVKTNAISIKQRSLQRK